MYILVGSVTTATRLKKVAEKIIGFPAYVVHTPSALNQGGCSYSVRVDDRALNEIRKIAGDNEIPIRRICRCMRRFLRVPCFRAETQDGEDIR